jgi:hypothetical protein
VLTCLALLSQLLPQLGAVFCRQLARVVIGCTCRLLSMQGSTEVGPAALCVTLGRIGWCCHRPIAAGWPLLTRRDKLDLAAKDQKYRVRNV